MINFVDKIDSIENPFPRSIRTSDKYIYMFGHDCIRRYTYQGGLLEFDLSFEQCIDYNFNQVLFLNQILTDEKGNLLVINANKHKDTVFLSLYNESGVCIKKTSIRKRHCFTECQSLNSSQVILHDHQNYLEIYKFNSDSPNLIEKIYKLSVRLDIPFIFTGLAMSEKTIFLMTAQKNNLIIYQKDLTFVKQEKVLQEESPKSFEVETNKEKDVETKPEKKIDNLSAFTMTAEIQLPESFPFNFIYNSGALFFSTNEKIYRHTLGGKDFDTFDIKSVLRLVPNDANSVGYLSMLDIGLISVTGESKESFKTAVQQWQDWGMQEKTEMIEVQKIAPQIFIVLTPQDCFIVDNGSFVRCIEFFPVLTQSFRV